MTTTKEVITDALEDILELSAEEPIQANDASAAMRYLNDMMTMWAAQGISLGYTKVSKLNDPITVPEGAIAGIKPNLSIFLAAKFDATVSPSLTLRAVTGLKAIRNLAFQAPVSHYPSILPRGSGNTCPGESAFYPTPDANILTEVGGSIALEDETGE